MAQVRLPVLLGYRPQLKERIFVSQQRLKQALAAVKPARIKTGFLIQTGCRSHYARHEQRPITFFKLAFTALHEHQTHPGFRASP
jgi:hypothetical protein